MCNANATYNNNNNTTIHYGNCKIYARGRRCTTNITIICQGIRRRQSRYYITHFYRFFFYHYIIIGSLWPRRLIVPHIVLFGIDRNTYVCIMDSSGCCYYNILYHNTVRTADEQPKTNRINARAAPSVLHLSK